MGNFESTPGDVGWKFVGRDEEMQEMKKLIQKNQLVQVSGMKKIGKSRFISELCRQLQENKCVCFWKDFELDNVNSGRVLYKWFHQILIAIKATEEKREFEKRYKSNTIACDSCCEKCQNHKTDECLNRNNLIDTEVNTLINCLRECPKEIMLFLDNIEKIIDSPLKDSFLSFLKHSLSQNKLRTILASSNKIKQTLRSFASFELKPLDKSAILELLFETTEQRERDSEVKEDVSTNVTYSPELKVFKRVNKPYMEAIAGLCEGCPLAALMSGLLLIEDECLYTPADLVEILICMRLKCLSPDNCPPDDRLDICQSEMKQVGELSSFFNAMNENMTGTKFNIREAVAVADEACEGVETEAMVKHKILKKALDRCILSIESMSGEQQMIWHGILRECQFALQVLDNLPSGNAKEMVLKFTKDNVKKAGLDFDKEILSDPKSLERAIKSLTLEESDKPPVQAREGREKRSLSIRDEHQVATEMFDTEQNEEELPKDLENNPDDPSSTSTKKNAHRYVRASYDSSDNEHKLEFEAKEATKIEAEQSSSQNNRDTNEELSLSRPPSYSRIQEHTDESSALVLNQNRLNKYGEPPPSYSKEAPANHLTIPNVEVIKHGTISQTGSSAMPTSRSNSWPMDTNLFSSSKFHENRKQKDQNTVSNSNPEKISRTNLLRVESDPSCNRPMDLVPSQLSVTSRREFSNSLTGPPAMLYIPPRIEGEQHKHIHLHNDGGNPQQDMERQDSGNVVNDINEPNTKLNGPKSDFFPSGFSSKGPAGLTYYQSQSNDLSIDQGNMSASLPFSQPHYIGDRSQMNTQPQSSRLSIAQSKEEHRRRSPVAVVSPVPRHRSPPNAEKHSPQDQRNPGEAQL